MIKSIPYISPSMFYYWDNCPLRAVYYHKYKHKQLFPKHPDADLGSIIHSFYENKHKWGIINEKIFNKKWDELIDKLNKDYKENILQSQYIPIQWHSNYYAVKKKLLKDSLLTYKKAKLTTSRIKNEVWIEDKGKIVAGKVDMLIYDKEGNVTEIIDYKTGKIFEKKEGKLVIKEVYKTQLALYSKIIIDKQDINPLLSIITLKGQKYNIENTNDFIIQTYNKAVSLKDTINKALMNGDYCNLSKTNKDNCYRCNYRNVCDAYKKVFFNNPIKKSIDVKGKIVNITNTCFDIETGNKSFRIVNNAKLNVINNKILTIYNLYFPDKENLVLYTQKDTIIEYE